MKFPFLFSAALVITFTYFTISSQLLFLTFTQKVLIFYDPSS